MATRKTETQDGSGRSTILDPSDILTPDELAARLKVRRTWIYEKMRSRTSNRLPGIRLGKYWRFHWPSVCEWLQAQSETRRP
jgi:excisionase family DNA binding protein